MSLLLFQAFATAATPRPAVVVTPFGALMAAADRAVQRNLGGATIIYQPEAGAPVPVVGVFDALFVLAKGDAHAGVEALGPAVFLRLEDLPVNPEDDEPTLMIAGVAYRVIERMPDGIGGIVLALRLVT